MSKVFVIYKGNEKIAEGASPLTIDGLAPSTFFPEGTYQVAYKERTEKTNIPSFITLPIKESRNLTINGEERIGDYYVLDISQEDYLAIQDYSNETIYRVQPDIDASGRVYFLGDVPIDVSKKDNVVEYTRNYYPNNSSEWQEVTYSGWSPPNTAFTSTLKELNLKPGDKISASAEYQNNSSMAVTTELKVQKSSGRLTAPSNEIASSSSGISKGEIILPEDTVSLSVTPGVKGNASTSVTISYRQVKMYRGSKDEMCGYTVAPEIIIGNKSSVSLKSKTIPELKSLLDDRMISYKSTDRKSDLIKLLEGESV